MSRTIKQIVEGKRFDDPINRGDILTARLAQTSAVKVAVYFVTLIIFGTMIILNFFIGILMNSMSERHEEIAQREAAADPECESLAAQARRLGMELQRPQTLTNQLRRRAEFA